MKTVYLDIETTGLNPPYDEILEIGILDDDDNVLLATLIKPYGRKSWESAERIHGISPEDVKDAPTRTDIMTEIIKHIKGKRVVIYNKDFELQFLAYELSFAKEVKCCMKAFAKGGHWSSLTYAARCCGYQYNSHRAIADCRATRAVWQSIDKGLY